MEIAKRDLEAALQVVSIGTTSTSDLTSHFVFRRSKSGTYEVLSSNHRLGCSMPLVGCKISEDDNEDTAFTVESWRLNRWLGASSDVVSLEFSDGLVKATNSQGTVKFSSLDPANFPFWDDVLESATKSYKINAKRFHAALNHIRLVISDKDTTRPQIAVTEVKNGYLESTDAIGFCYVKIPELGKSGIRYHGKDLGQIISFLSSCGDGDVEIREHDKCSFLIREDGGLLTVNRPKHEFPNINVERDEDPYWFTVKTDDLIRAINTLAASASKEDTRLQFSVDIHKKTLSLSMMAVSADRVVLKIGAPSMESMKIFHEAQKTMREFLCLSLEEMSKELHHQNDEDSLEELKKKLASLKQKIVDVDRVCSTSAVIDVAADLLDSSARQDLWSIHLKNLKEILQAEQDADLDQKIKDLEKAPGDMDPREVLWRADTSFPTEFSVSYPYLLKFWGKTKLEEIRFGVNPEESDPSRGLFRFFEDRDGDEYRALLVWLQ